MPFPEIQLDDRNFERLVADAKRRIPGYTPEWTDLNDSDPGITLVHLFAWLEEMILWRLNRVPAGPLAGTRSTGRMGVLARSRR